MEFDWLKDAVRELLLLQKQVQQSLGQAFREATAAAHHVQVVVHGRRFATWVGWNLVDFVVSSSGHAGPVTPLGAPALGPALQVGGFGSPGLSQWQTTSVRNRTCAKSLWTSPTNKTSPEKQKVHENDVV